MARGERNDVQTKGDIAAGEGGEGGRKHMSHIWQERVRAKIQGERLL